MRASGTQQGFTIIELMVVIGIMAAVMTIAALSISDYQRRSRLRETARAIEGDLITVRTAARTRQQAVCVNVTNGGYTAFVDANGDGVYKASDGDVLILSNSFTGPVQLQGTGGFTVPGSFQFTAIGNVSSQTQIAVAEPGQPRQYRITIYQTGITQVDRSDDGWTSYTRAW